MDITPMVTTMERDPPMLRLRLRLTQRHSMLTMVTLTVWATTLAMLDMAMLVTPSLMEESPPPTLLLGTPLPTLPGESPTPPMLVSAPTTSVPSSLARQSALLSQHEFFVKFIEFLIKT